MHIKELRLDNFKSFGEKTAVPFYEGFTTISGPNGSGKSNLIDSILFALGLARTRGLRAQKLPDLLYDPPEGPSAKECSVEVVLDNEDRAVTEEEIRAACGEANGADEIVIKRRLKETESDYYSYYYINGRSVNLSDIQELLANAGVTPEGYNVVMQGDVTNVVQMGSTERRGIVEEAAGTAEFDERKEEAFDEMATVEERVEDTELILEEIEERLDGLKRERDRALEYRELKEEKEEHEAMLSAARLREVEREIAEVEDEIAEEEETKSQLEDDLEEAERRVEEAREELRELQQEIETKGEDERLELVSEIEELKGKITSREERISDAEGNLEEFDTKRREYFVGADKAREEIEEIEEEMRDVKVRKSSIKSDLTSKRSELEQVEEEIAHVEGEYADVREELGEAKEERGELEDAKHELQRTQDRLLDEARRRSSEIEEVEEEIAHAEEQLEAAEEERADVVEQLEKHEDNVQELEAVREDLKVEKRELQEDLEEVEEELRQKQQEYTEAEAKGGQGSSYSRAVSTVLNSDVDGVHGTIADLGSVEGKYATALETAAGGRMANVVVDDDGVGQDCIELLKRRNVGRATFLPISEMYSRSLSQQPLAEDGVIDYAYELVEFDPEYEGVFSYVFGDTLVVEDLETARSMMGDHRMVTLDGDLVEKSGAMTGGSQRESRYSFGSKGAVERIADRIEELEQERRGIKDDLADVNGRIEETREKLDDARSTRDRYASRKDDLDDDVAEHQQTIATKRDRIEEIEREREETRDEMEELEEEIAAKDDAIDDLADRIAEMEAEIEGSRLSELTERADGLREEIGELEDRRRDVDGELDELELEKNYKEKKVEEFEQDIRELDEKRDEKEQLIDDLEDEIAEIEEKIEAKEEEVAEIEEQLGELKDERDAQEEAVEDRVEVRDKTRRKLERCSDRIADLRVDREELEADAEELREQVEQRPDDEETPDLDEVQATIAEIEDEMEALEPVNMLAIDEYEEVSERQEDLQDRKETLMEEKREIEERIERYEELKEETFMEAFAAINEHFREIFQRLSDGSGELVLEEPDDPFEAGMTIEAEPADKPVKRLEQMSGGERSLTALSFIFAVQRYTPAPFYAFDEVDMFLDAPNAERVAEMIDDLSEDAQFAVVSLRTPMIERAERTVGVAMAEDNVSTVTGVKLNEGAGGDAEPAEAD